MLYELLNFKGQTTQHWFFYFQIAEVLKSCE